MTSSPTQPGEQGMLTSEAEPTEGQSQGTGAFLRGNLNFPPSFQTFYHQPPLLMLRGNYGDGYLTCLQLCERFLLI